MGVVHIIYNVIHIIYEIVRGGGYMVWVYDVDNNYIQWTDMVWVTYGVGDKYILWVKRIYRGYT